VLLLMVIVPLPGCDSNCNGNFPLPLALYSCLLWLNLELWQKIKLWVAIMIGELVDLLYSKYFWLTFCGTHSVGRVVMSDVYRLDCSICMDSIQLNTERAHSMYINS
jgi:hypothetical protein